MVVPAKVVEVGVHENIVVGRVEFSPDSDTPFENAEGYFILDTETGKVVLRLSQEELGQRLSNLGVSEIPRLSRPSKDFDY